MAEGLGELPWHYLSRQEGCDVIQEADIQDADTFETMLGSFNLVRAPSWQLVPTGTNSGRCIYRVFRSLNRHRHGLFW